ncbi:cyclase family protein [Tissierella carlieri]|uniref:Cyclase family protein n=1 Tax=Tissierella carlieri TaxID=689904 RepID=A0ABT1SGS5_9FIRM|nr:cyclase family protein [Tissierella carlieri]MCQ4925127.1 cyclase family protein [Tissierella carlieri]
MEKLIDLSWTIEDNMPVYPGDSITSLKQVKNLQEDFYDNHRLDISMHSGTHIDSPMHLTESKEYIYEMPLESFIGIGCIIDVRNQLIIKEKLEYKELIEENSIVLLYTGWDQEYGKDFYYENHPVIDISFAKLLIEKNIKMLGIDMPSPDRYPFETHKLLFKNKICIMENLRNLDKLLGVPSFEVIAFPLKIRADSSMTRAVARVL